MKKLILGMVMIGLLGCGEAPGLEKQESAFTQTGPADPPATFYVDNFTLLRGAFSYSMAGSTTNPITARHVMRLTANVPTQDPRTQGAAWHASIGPENPGVDVHAMKCETTMYYYENNFASPPLPNSAIPGTSFSGNQGYWFNGASFGCTAWKHLPFNVWQRTSVLVPYASFVLFEARAPNPPFTPYGLNGRMISPSLASTWISDFGHP